MSTPIYWALPNTPFTKATISTKKILTMAVLAYGENMKSKTIKYNFCAKTKVRFPITTMEGVY